jgi:DNA transformation protein
MLTPLDQLRNIGPKSADLLGQSGYLFIEDVREVGPVLAYHIVSQLHQGVSLNLLWALAAGLQDRDWRDLSESEKQSLQDELKQLQLPDSQN